MEDRVAEVLAQREALDHGFAVGLILSLLLHGGATAAAVWAALHAPRVQIIPTLNIKFAPMPAPIAPAAPKPAATPKIEPPKPAPIKKQETKKPPEKNTVPFSPFGKSQKKGSETPPPAPPQPPATRQPANPATPVGATVDADFPYTIYIERMKTLIGSRWLRPQITGDASVVVYFVIERDGTIRDTRVETASGNSTFDRAALRAILESSPLPPLPFGYNGTWLGVHLTFR